MRVATGEPGIHGTGGTPSFMAPEQLDSDLTTIGPSIDVYGIGGVLYGLLTGHAPVERDTVDEVMDWLR